MPETSANLQRRAKRRAWAPEHRLFVVCAPGLEDLCAQEVTGLGLDQVEAMAGGVACQGKLGQAFQANLWLRSGARVLLRLADFRVRDWADLERQAGRAPWEIYLPASALLKIQVTLRESNLKHSGRIAELLLQTAAQRLTQLKLAPPQEALAGQTGQRVMLRAAGRRATLSLDSSGEHLHKRGYRLDSGPAPLREDLAAALLMFCGYDGSQTLLDPMCGSGTLAIEAALLARNLAPGLNRAFAFEQWPAFRPAPWQHLRTQAQEQALARGPAPILARDLSPKALAAARANAERAGVVQDLELDQADFLAAPAPEGPPGLVVINPPYGQRLASPGQAKDFHAALGRHLRRAYQGWRVGMVLGQAGWARLLGLKEEARRLVPHGGLKVTLWRGRA